MTEKEMAVIAQLMARALRDRKDSNSLSAVRKEVAELCSSFTPYGD
jgi:glycine/serine hydroxymethyltransferase